MKFFHKIIRNNEGDEPINRGNLERMIAITNQKGGVGKSTTAVNVSAYLGAYGYKTLLIDLDPQNNSTSGLGVDPSSFKETIYDIFIHESEPCEVILNTEYENLKIKPSS